MQLAHSKLPSSENKAGKLALSALVIMENKKKEKKILKESRRLETKKIINEQKEYACLLT